MRFFERLFGKPRRARFAARAPNDWLAHDLNGDHWEEVTHARLFPRSPTARPGNRRARRGIVAPDRAAIPGQHLLRHSALAAPPHHRLPGSQTPRGRTTSRPGAGGLGATSRV